MISPIALTWSRQAITFRQRAFLLAAIILGVIAVSCSSNSATITAPSPSKCELALALASSTIDASGGTGRLVVTTTAECTWSATSQTAWISGITPASGQGSGEIEFRVAANSLPSAREGDLVVNDQRAVVRQGAAACRFQIAPDALDSGADGGTHAVAVTTVAGCGWSAASDVEWIVVTPSSGTGDATLHLEVARNAGGARIGTARIGGQIVTVRQSAAAPTTCGAAITPKSQTIGVAGGAGGPISVATPDVCAWTAVSNVSWITITAGRSGNGPGAVTYTVAANSGSGRTGTLTIAGETFVVTQDGVVSCSYTVAPTAQNVAAAGGVPPAIQVLTSAPGCAWTATTSSGWVTVQSGASGTGSGTVTYQVAANPGPARTATLTVAGQAITITQDAAPCSYTIAPTSHSAPVEGGSVTVAVTTTPAGCSWTARSNANWITVNSGANGSGNGSVTLGVSPNLGASRVGTVTIAGETFTVTQAALVCSYVIAPTSYRADRGGGDGPPITVTTPSGCAWTATSNVSWIRITSGASGTGPGTVRFRVDRNSGPRREGTLTIGGQTFTVTQDKG